MDETTKNNQVPAHRNCFVFMRPWVETLDQIQDPAQRLELYEAIAHYSIDKTEPSFNDGGLLPVWLLLKPRIDLGWKKYEKMVREEGRV